MMIKMTRELGIFGTKRWSLVLSLSIILIAAFAQFVDAKKGSYTSNEGDVIVRKHADGTVEIVDVGESTKKVIPTGASTVRRAAKTRKVTKTVKKSNVATTVTKTKSSSGTTVVQKTTPGKTTTTIKH